MQIAGEYLQNVIPVIEGLHECQDQCDKKRYSREYSSFEGDTKPSLFIVSSGGFKGLTMRECGEEHRRLCQIHSLNGIADCRQPAARGVRCLSENPQDRILPVHQLDP